jgi:hypothetical protein
LSANESANSSFVLASMLFEVGAPMSAKEKVKINLGALYSDAFCKHGAVSEGLLEAIVIAGLLESEPVMSKIKRESVDWENKAISLFKHCIQRRHCIPQAQIFLYTYRH